jgi:hypothetical protein
MLYAEYASRFRGASILVAPLSWEAFGPIEHYYRYRKPLVNREKRK